jgi:hypothetical protein
VGAAIDAIAQRDGCSAAEALYRLAEIGLAELADADNRPRELRGDERAAVVIHLEATRVRPRRSANADSRPLEDEQTHVAADAATPDGTGSDSIVAMRSAS